MRLLMLFLLSVFLSVPGCSQRTTLAGRKLSGGQMITDLGEHRVVGGVLTVIVSEPGGKLEVVRGKHFDDLTATNPATAQITYSRNASLTNTISLAGWKAQPGWFVFVQNESRIWAYDGDQYLCLFAYLDEAGVATYGPHKFPYPVPKPVMQRLPDSVKNRIETHPR
jgi:hypothetical protein